MIVAASRAAVDRFRRRYGPRIAHINSSYKEADFMSRKTISLVLPLAILATAVSLDAAGGQPRRHVDLDPVAMRAAAPLQGRLEMVWGDAAPGSSAEHRQQLSLVDDAGRRTLLDPAAALKAAGDLHALYGRRAAWSRGRSALLSE